MQHLHLLSIVNSMMRNLQSYKTSEYTNQKNKIYFCNLLCVSPPSPFHPHPPHPLSSAFFLPSPFLLLIPSLNSSLHSFLYILFLSSLLSRILTPMPFTPSLSSHFLPSSSLRHVYKQWKHWVQTSLSQKRTWCCWVDCQILYMATCSSILCCAPFYCLWGVTQW